MLVGHPKVKVVKITSIDRNKVFSTVTDIESFPQKLAQYFNSVKVLIKEGDSIITKESVKVAGRDIV